MPHINQPHLLILVYMHAPFQPTSPQSMLVYRHTPYQSTSPHLMLMYRHATFQSTSPQFMLVYRHAPYQSTSLQIILMYRNASPQFNNWFIPLWLSHSLACVSILKCCLYAENHDNLLQASASLVSTHANLSCQITQQSKYDEMH